VQIQFLQLGVLLVKWCCAESAKYQIMFLMDEVWKGGCSRVCAIEILLAF